MANPCEERKTLDRRYAEIDRELEALDARWSEMSAAGVARSSWAANRLG